MYLEKCTIRNIKCFEDLTLDFRNPDGSIRLWNVLIGENGTGKTTLLQAIAIALLGEKAASVLLPRPWGWVRAGAEKGEIAATIYPGPGDFEMAEAGTEAASRFGHHIEVRYDLTEKASQGVNDSKIIEHKGMDDQRLKRIRSAETISWFAAGYGPFRRLGGGTEHAHQIAQTNTREARFVTLFLEDAALSDCEKWLMDLDYARLDASDPERQQHSKDLLNVIRETLNDNLLPDGVTLDAITSRGVFFKTPYADKVRMADLSDGYRAMLALVLDLIRLLCVVFTEDEIVPLRTDSEWLHHVSAVVLIDEIDAHLHPTWQREIGLWLKRHFPRVQFIVTTHSPFIPQIADDNGLFTLRRHPNTHVVQAEQEETSVRGWRADQILSILFETSSMYDPETELKLREYGRLKALEQMGRLPADQVARFAELQAWVEHYLAPSGDTREEMHEFRVLDRRVQELSTRLREQKKCKCNDIHTTEKW